VPSNYRGKEDQKEQERVVYMGLIFKNKIFVNQGHFVVLVVNGCVFFTFLFLQMNWVWENVSLHVRVCLYAYMMILKRFFCQ